MVKLLFTPAILVLNRLGYRNKFGIMGVLALVAIGVLAANLYQSQDKIIRDSRQELLGVEAVQPLARLIQHLQIHRGLSSGVLNGNQAMQDQRAARQTQVNQAMASVQGRLPPELIDSDSWQRVQERWVTIEKDGLEWIPRENFTSHTRLIAELLDFQLDVADQFLLTNDPGLDTSYLINTALQQFPQALEQMGQLRALGTGILAKKQPVLPSQQVNISLLVAELNGAISSLRRNLNITARLNPHLQAGLTGALRDVGAAADKVTTLVNQDILSGKFETAPDAYFALTTDSLEKGYREMFDGLFPTLNQLLNQRIGDAERHLHLGLVVSALMILFYAYAAIGLYLATVGSISHLADKARTIATGDLGVRVSLATRDELGLVADSLNDMVESFARLIERVRDSANEVIGASKSLAASSAHVSQGSRQQTEAASSIATAIEQITTGISHLSASAEDANQIASHAGELSAEGTQVVDSVVREIERIAEVVNQSASVIADLGGRSEQISAIVRVIREIADQTNLLALNAAIEAARAGESGRGFAVVADEVRKLAERTSGSTQEISTMISAIQKGTRDAVESMQIGVQRVDQGVAQANRAGASMREIGTGARQVVENVANISRSLREQSAASTQVAGNVERVARMAEANNAAISANADTANRLEQLSAGLAAEVSRFRLA